MLQNIFLVCTPICDIFGGTLVAKELKIAKYICFGEEGSLGAVAPRVPSYVPGMHATTSRVVL